MAKKYIITVNGTKYEVVVEDANPNVVYTPAAAPVAPAAPVAAPAPVEAPAAAPAPVAAPVAGGEKITYREYEGMNHWTWDRAYSEFEDIKALFNA